MTTIQSDTLKFLKELKKNNDRSWFEKNKPRYKAAQENLIEFVDELIPKLMSFDKSLSGVEAKKTVFRIYRDVRFSKDKRPYKENLGAHIQSGSKMEPKAGYYLHLEPGGCFLAGGAYLPSGPWLKSIRKEIHYEGNDLKKILKSASFKKFYGEIQGDKLKTTPKGYDADHKHIELLRMKSFLAVHNLKDSQVNSKDLLAHCTKAFKALYPFDAFFNRASE